MNDDDDHLKLLQQRLDAIDQLTDYEAKILLKLLLTTLTSTHELLTDRLDK
jgi:hypothetical protein